MSNWVQLIKKIAKEERETSKPCTYTIGTVKNVNPLRVKLEQSLTLESAFLVQLQGISLTNGDKVALMRKDGGQEYLVIGKVV